VSFFLIIILLALVFDFINGFHDAANSIATVVSTKVLTPFQAVLWAAFFNFVAYWLFELKVADTVAKTVKPEFITLPGSFFRTHCGHHLESAYLVERNSVQLLAYIDRRICGRRHCQCRNSSRE
jgi:phosphate/sulfate permease